MARAAKTIEITPVFVGLLDAKPTSEIANSVRPEAIQPESSRFSRSNPAVMLDRATQKASLERMKPSTKRRPTHGAEQANTAWRTMSEELLLLLASDDTRE